MTNGTSDDGQEKINKDALEDNPQHTTVYVGNLAPQCKQQKGGWECGYMVLQHMFDFVNLYQNQFPDEMWHGTREATDNDLDVLLMKLMPKFFSELGISLD
ncbi:hypothetical protein Hdeb2414_s0002g00051971 [Helianthus debilis subsp. tardiflorus]